MQRLFGRGQRRCVAIMTKKKTIIRSVRKTPVRHFARGYQHKGFLCFGIDTNFPMKNSCFPEEMTY